MRIACLQFAPQVGEIDNNLNRADAVLAKANQDDVDSLDLLVLPELAFSGMMFLKHISICASRASHDSSCLWKHSWAMCRSHAGMD